MSSSYSTVFWLSQYDQKKNGLEYNTNRDQKIKDRKEKTEKKNKNWEKEKRRRDQEKRLKGKVKEKTDAHTLEKSPKCIIQHTKDFPLIHDGL